MCSKTRWTTTAFALKHVLLIWAIQIYLDWPCRFGQRRRPRVWYSLAYLLGDRSGKCATLTVFNFSPTLLPLKIPIESSVVLLLPRPSAMAAVVLDTAKVNRSWTSFLIPMATPVFAWQPQLDRRYTLVYVGLYVCWSGFISYGHL